MAYSNFGAQFQAFVIRVANSIKELVTKTNTLTSNITTLDTNVVKTINNNKPTNGNITPAQTGCLPLGGGFMTGQIHFPTGVITSNNTDTVKELFVSSDNDSGIFGAFLSLHRSDCPQEPGAFGLFTRNTDGGLGPSLFAKTNGSLFWNGNEVERIVQIKGCAVRYESGLQICWGENKMLSSGSTITFDLPFADKGISVIVTGSGNPSEWIIQTAVNDTTTTGFVGYCQAEWSCKWFAIGWWK